MAEQKYTKREQILIGMLNHLWRLAGETWISPDDVRRAVTVAERLLERADRKKKLSETGKGERVMSKVIRFSHEGQEIALDQTNIAAVTICREDIDDDFDSPFVLAVIERGATEEAVFSAEFKLKQDAIALRDKILNECRLQGWFKIPDGEDETVLDRFEVSSVEIVKDDFDDDRPYLAVFNKKGASDDPLYIKSFRTKAEALALRKAFLECLKTH